MTTPRHRVRPARRHARPARWWPPVVLAAGLAAVIPGDTAIGLLVSATVLVLFTAVAVARRRLGAATVRVDLILAEELGPAWRAPAARAAHRGS